MIRPDAKEARELNAAPWQVALLRLNPSYCGWGPGQDYMFLPPESKGWNSNLKMATWKDFEITPDDLNEIVHFYFELKRENKNCEHCKGKGGHEDAFWVSESFYRHDSPFKPEEPRAREIKNLLDSFSYKKPDASPLANASFPSEELLGRYKPEFRTFCESMRDGDGEWCNKITLDEFEALKKQGRCSELKTVEEVNGAQGGMGHDAINRWILISARLKRFGMPEHCPSCKGQGFHYTAPVAHVALTLWILHPRKSASRGCEIERIERHELPEVFKLLRDADKLNRKRFATIPRHASTVRKFAGPKPKAVVQYRELQARLDSGHFSEENA